MTNCSPFTMYTEGDENTPGTGVELPEQLTGLGIKSEEVAHDVAAVVWPVDRIHTEQASKGAVGDRRIAAAGEGG